MAQDETKRSRRYVVVARSLASVIFDQNHILHVGSAPEVICSFKTRYRSTDFGISVPGHFYVEARGEASSLESAIENFVNVARSITSAISLSTIAYIGPLEVEL
jgi:hypothetical protein